LQVEKALSKSFHVVYHHDATAVHPSDVNFSFEETSKVYVHFRRRIEKMEHPVRNLLDIPNKLPPFPENIMDYAYCNESGDLLDILYKDAPVKKDSRSAFPWKGGEEAAKERLNSYLFKTGGAASYKETRNGMVGTEYSTKFSVFLAHGCLSPRLVWHELDRLASTRKGKRVSPGSDQDGLYWIKFELLWRDYFRYLMAGNGNKVFHLHGFRKSKQEALEQAKLYDKPNKKPKLSYYDKEWKVNGEHFDKWKTGQTGVPFVDAGMRELLLTGFMNNRSRQNVASYLSKDLELDWRMGAEWFESLLMDHDVYSNYGNWQYGKCVIIQVFKFMLLMDIYTLKKYLELGVILEKE
jgi:deoxyribodipyrimidine photo-lyase